MASATSTKEGIVVPAKMSGSRILVPEMTIADEIYFNRDENGKVYRGADYHNENPDAMTSAEAVHAYLDAEDGTQMEWHRNDKGVYVPESDAWACPKYREAVKNQSGMGEWLSTFIEDDKRVIVRPERVFEHEKYGWIADNGTVIWLDFEMPESSGDFILELCPITGLVKKVTKSREEAEERFGDDASRCYINDKDNREGLRQVCRYCLSYSGPVYLSTLCTPGDRDDDLGSRSCRRSEQDAKHLATPLYSASQEEIDELRKLQEQAQTNPAKVARILHEREQETSRLLQELADKSDADAKRIEKLLSVMKVAK